MNPELICEVCRQEPAVGVGSSTLGAMSLAYGAECLHRSADAPFMLESVIYTIGPDPGDYAAWFWDINTFVDGRYLSARELFDQLIAQPGFFDGPDA